MPACRVLGCARDAERRGMCPMHYSRWWVAGGTLDTEADRWWCECDTPLLDGWGQCQWCGRVPEWWVRARLDAGEQA